MLSVSTRSGRGQRRLPSLLVSQTRTHSPLTACVELRQQFVAESGASLPMMKLAGRWSSSTVAEGFIAKSKRTLKTIAEGVGLDEVAGSTVASAVRVDDASNDHGNDIQEVSRELENVPPNKRTRTDKSVTTEMHGIHIRVYHFENVPGTFYFGLPAPVPQIQSTHPRSPLVLQIPRK